MLPCSYPVATLEPDLRTQISRHPEGAAGRDYAWDGCHGRPYVRGAPHLPKNAVSPSWIFAAGGRGDDLGTKHLAQLMCIWQGSGALARSNELSAMPVGPRVVEILASDKAPSSRIWECSYLGGQRAQRDGTMFAPALVAGSTSGDTQKGGKAPFRQVDFSTFGARKANFSPGRAGVVKAGSLESPTRDGPRGGVCVRFGAILAEIWPSEVGATLEREVGRGLVLANRGRRGRERYARIATGVPRVLVPRQGSCATVASA